MSDPNGVPLSSTFLEFCVRVRNNDPSILPESGEPFIIRRLSQREQIELADALLENNNVTYLELGTKTYTKTSADAMAKYVRTSSRLRHIRWNGEVGEDDQELRHREEMLCCFLLVTQESTSLKELQINFVSLVGHPTWRSKTC
jgi:hypothetical protein